MLAYTLSTVWRNGFKEARGNKKPSRKVRSGMVEHFGSLAQATVGTGDEEDSPEGCLSLKTTKAGGHRLHRKAYCADICTAAMAFSMRSCTCVLRNWVVCMLHINPVEYRMYRSFWWSALEPKVCGFSLYRAVLSNLVCDWGTRSRTACFTFPLLLGEIQQ